MKIGILQPAYIPWLGYFEQIAYVDLFVFMDDVQYTRHDWRNRNRVRTSGGESWLTVPVKRHAFGTPINEVQINYSKDWIRKQLKTLELNYRVCRHFNPFFENFKKQLLTRPERLVDLDCGLIHEISRYLQIATPFALASEVKREPAPADADADAKNWRILEICRHYNATVLYDGASAAQFIDVQRFAREGCRVVFQEYAHPSYPQRFGKFLTHMSTLDLIFNLGGDARDVLLSSPPPDLSQRP